MCSPTWNPSSSPSKSSQSQHQHSNTHNHTHNHARTSHYKLLRSKLESILSADNDGKDGTTTTTNTGSVVDWNTVNDLLMELRHYQIIMMTSSPNTMIVSDDESEEEDTTMVMNCEDEDDDLNNDDDIDEDGRQTVCKLLSHHDLPLYTLQLFLSIPAFTKSLHYNPSAFFTASLYCSGDRVEGMTRYMMEHVTSCSLQQQHLENDAVCPYPWLLSPHVSVDTARGILQAYPQGVWQSMTRSTMMSSSSTSSTTYGLLDHFLWSPQMIARRDWDETLWMKFKLVLLAAEHSSNSDSANCDSTSFSPIRTILDRIATRDDFFEDFPRAQHVLWLLHQLRGTDGWIFSKPSLKDQALPLHCLLSRNFNELYNFQELVDSGEGAAKSNVMSPPVGLVIARELCKILIAGFPQAVKEPMMVDKRPLLPLHVALENGWPCHDLLLSVFPESLNMTDPRTGLLPFQMAAFHGRVSNSSSTVEKKNQQHGQSSENSSILGLDATFEMLRSNPLSCSIEAGRSGTTTTPNATEMA